MLHTVIFIGRSGSGKGTQARLLCERISKFDEDRRQILYVETGEKFRQFIRGENFSRDMAREVNDSGGLQPSFLACWMWSHMLIEELQPDMHLVFDGTPRSLEEAQVLSTAISFYERETPTVVYINVSNKWSEERLLSRGRRDDKSLAKINKRLGWFDDKVLPAIEYYKKNPMYKLIEVDGEQSIEKVASDILAQYEYAS